MKIPEPIRWLILCDISQARRECDHNLSRGWYFRAPETRECWHHEPLDAYESVEDLLADKLGLSAALTLRDRGLLLVSDRIRGRSDLRYAWPYEVVRIDRHRGDVRRPHDTGVVWRSLRTPGIAPASDDLVWRRAQPVDDDGLSVNASLRLYAESMDEDGIGRASYFGLRPVLASVLRGERLMIGAAKYADSLRRTAEYLSGLVRGCRGPEERLAALADLCRDLDACRPVLDHNVPLGLRGTPRGSMPVVVYADKMRSVLQDYACAYFVGRYRAVLLERAERRAARMSA